MERGSYMCAFLFTGHVTITNYLLNYFPSLDLERRNLFGFTALMKAAMQGRTECIRALMLAGTSHLSCAGPPCPVQGNAEFAPFFFSSFLLWPYLRCVEVPRLGVELEL